MSDTINRARLIPAAKARALREASEADDSRPWTVEEHGGRWEVRMGLAIVAECGREADARLVAEAGNLAYTVEAIREAEGVDAEHAIVGSLIEGLQEGGNRVEMLLQSDGTWLVMAFRRKADVKAAADSSLVVALRQVSRLVLGFRATND